MEIARQLRENNVCEYLLYMWQVEDTIRALGLDIERIRTEYLSGFQFTPDQEQKELEWFENLVRMMREEGCTERGHLQVIRGTLSLLVDLHRQLLQSPKHPFYSAAYYRALPFIVELRARNGNRADGAESGNETTLPVEEIETCLNCLYGVMLLRLQKKEVSKETQTAVTAISRLLAMLSDAWKKEKQGTLAI